MNPETTVIEDRMILGYYPLRGKAQVCRLLCEYFKLPYKDMLFTPSTWLEFKNTQHLNWTFEELPFLKDGETIITDTYPICLYLIHRAGRKDLIGTTLVQEINTDMLLCDTEPLSYALTACMGGRELTPETQLEAVERLWQKELSERMMKMENESVGHFFYQQLSLVDFFIYEMIFTLKEVDLEKLNKFPKLVSIFNNFSNIPEIQLYEQSKKAIKEISPLRFTNNWKQTMRARGKTM